MWSADCICCSPDTVQQASPQSVLAGTPPRKGTIAYVKCRCCGSKVCSFCVSGLEETVAKCNKKFPPDNPSIAALKSMSFSLKSHDQPVIDFGICCAFSCSIPTGTKSTIVTPSRAPEISISDPDDTEFILVSNEAANKKRRRLLNNNNNNDYSAANFLTAYYQNKTPPASMKPANTSTILRCLYKCRRKSRRPRYIRNHFQGALIFPPFGLLVEADATNHHLSCDHMALAESDVDSTKAVVHGVISDDNAKMVVHYLEANHKSICRINAVRERILLNVTSPEDISKNKNFVVDVFVVDQVKKCSEFEDWKGTTHFDTEYIAGLEHFGQDDIAYVSNAFMNGSLYFKLWPFRKCYLRLKLSQQQA